LAKILQFFRQQYTFICILIYDMIMNLQT